MNVGVVKETCPGENRVALVPSVVQKLEKAGLSVIVEADAGLAAGFRDQDFSDKGARIVGSREEVFSEADVVAQVRSLGSNPETGMADVELLRSGQCVIGQMEPLSPSEINKSGASTGATLFALELVPRITRAQSMDVLSSMATIAGYKAVLLAASRLNRMFPMMMTAAGTITPAKVLVIGAGVAGLQAIASARRNGAVVFGYDIRAEVKEQIESLGAKFVELDLETGDAQDKGGYAKEMGEDFLKKQRELLTQAAAGSDVIICTAAVPGRKAPIIIPTSMVEAMMPGSIIVDLAAERGGNCELTRPGEEVVHNGVTILGPENVPATVPYHASEMYARNVVTFLLNMIKEGKLELDMEDEIIKDSMVAKDGDVVNDRVREALGLEPAAGEGASQ